MSIVQTDLYPIDKSSFLSSIYKFAPYVDSKKLNTYYSTFNPTNIKIKVEFTLEQNSILIKLINESTLESLTVLFNDSLKKE